MFLLKIFIFTTLKIFVYCTFSSPRDSYTDCVQKEASPSYTYIYRVNLPMQYAEIFKVVKMKIFSREKLIMFLIVAQNIDSDFGELVLTSTNNVHVCFK